MNKTSIAIIISAVLIVSAIVFTSKKNSVVNTDTSYQNQTQEITPKAEENKTEVKQENTTTPKTDSNKQIIEITAKGGYNPRVSVAKAGIPTILRINTNGTFDCSSSIRIPSLGISKYLPQSGVTDIDLGTNGPGTLYGSCGMGMYPFQINFQ